MKKLMRIAGPGSGKTRFIIEDILDNTLPSDRVAAITFTRNAAEEMRSRLGDRKLFHCGTIHGFALKMLRHQGTANRASRIIDDLMLEDLVTRSLSDVFSTQSVTAAMKAVRGDGKLEPLVEKRLRWYLRRYALMTYDDILLEFIKSFSDVWFDSVYVDEAQDLSETMWAAVGRIQTERLVLVGDPDQEIFPDACTGLMQRLAQEDFVVSTSEENHRCAAEICDMAAKLIEKNRFRGVGIRTKSATDKPGAVELWRSGREDEELNKVLELASVSEGSMAVLCRTRNHCKFVSDFLLAHGINPIDRRKRNPGWRKLLLALTVMADNGENPFFVDQWMKASGMDVVKAMHAVETTNNLLGWAINMVDEQAFKSLEQLIALRLSPGEMLDAAHEMPDPVRYDALGVDVMTIHSSKGLEWDTVCILGLEEGMLPMSGSTARFEEERRLCYVGMTRAVTRLVLSRCERRRMHFGNSPSTEFKKEPSRFLEEMR